MPFTPVHELRRVTQEDFLARVGRDRHPRQTYLDGIITPHPTARAAHTRICANLHSALQAQCKGSIPDCQVFFQPLLAACPPRPSSCVGMFAYADLAITLGPPDYSDASCLALRNPTIIVEVCSPDTEAFDMDEKFLRYRHGLSSLQEYVLVATDRCEIGHYRTQGPEQWPLTSYSALDDTLLLHRMPVRVALRDIYEGTLVHTNTAAEPLPREEPAWQWYER